jgi:hypothetical protein
LELPVDPLYVNSRYKSALTGAFLLATVIVLPGKLVQLVAGLIVRELGAEPRTPIDAVIKTSPLVVNSLAENDNL